MANRRSGGTQVRDGARAARQNNSKSAAAQRPRRKSAGHSRRKYSGVLLRLLTMFVMVAVFILGVAIFFKVTEIRIQGNVLYTAEEVTAASGIEQDDNLMTLSKAVAAGKIMAVLPYVEEVRITRMLPGTVIIEVRESDATYAVEAEDGSAWLINAGGKVLEPLTASAADYPRLTGVIALEPEVGAQIMCEQEDALEAAKLVMEQLETTDYISQIAEINVEKAYDIIVWYENQYEIHLGGSDDLPYKIEYLTSVLATLEERGTEESGIIDLTFEEEKVANFKPWQVSEEPEDELPEKNSENS